MWRVFALTVSAGLVALGCGAATLPAEVVVGQYEAPPHELWERSVHALRITGYEPIDANPARGQVTVAARSRGTTRGGARFELQLYHQGWVQIRVTGPTVQRTASGRVRLSGALASEYEALILELGQLLGAERTEDAGTPAPPEPS